jgi:hypothetical protein
MNYKLGSKEIDRVEVVVDMKEGRMILGGKRVVIYFKTR